MLFINTRIFSVPCFVSFLLTFKMWELFLLHPVLPTTTPHVVIQAADPYGNYKKNSSYKVQFVIIFNPKTTFNISKLDDNNITGVDNPIWGPLQMLANSKIS